MGISVPEQVRMQGNDSRLSPTPTHHLQNAIVREDSLAAQPERGEICVWMSGPRPNVAVERLGSLAPKWTRPRSARLARTILDRLIACQDALGDSRRHGGWKYLAR